MSIRDQINTDLKQAMRSQEKQTVITIRSITAAIKQIEVDERIEVKEDRLLEILTKLAKQRNESITQFKAADRQDLVEKEMFELEIIKQYLPAPLTDEAVSVMVNDSIAALSASSMQDMGSVMADLKPKLQGRADMSKVSKLIKEKLN